MCFVLGTPGRAGRRGLQAGFWQEAGEADAATQGPAHQGRKGLVPSGREEALMAVARAQPRPRPLEALRGRPPPAE